MRMHSTSEVDMNAMYAGTCDLLVSCGTVVATMAGMFGVQLLAGVVLMIL